jgi:hypothetical protein
VILRSFLAVAALAALGVAVLWTYALADVLGANYDPDPRLAGYERRSLTILGVLGIGALLVAGGSGVAYARTAARVWITGVVSGSVCGIPVLVVWIDLWEVFAGTD